MHTPTSEREEIPFRGKEKGTLRRHDHFDERGIGGENKGVLNAEGFFKRRGIESVVGCSGDGGGVSGNGGENGGRSRRSRVCEDVRGGDVGYVARVADVGACGYVVGDVNESLVLEVFADAGEVDLWGDVVLGEDTWGRFVVSEMEGGEGV